MQLLNNSFPAFSLKGRLQFLLAFMRIISICIKKRFILYMFQRTMGKQVINNLLALKKKNGVIKDIKKRNFTK